MNELLATIRRFLDYFRFWIMVSPWEQVVRVRLGKRVTVLNAGVHLRLPFIDHTYSQSIRLRICSLGRQTTTSRDSQTITFGASLGYAINNIEKLYRTLHHAEDTISNIARSAIANYISMHDLQRCHPHHIQEHCNQQLDLEPYGLCDVKVYLTEFAVVKTYRLIGDYGSGYAGSSLFVEAPDTQSPNTPR